MKIELFIFQNKKKIFSKIPILPLEEAKIDNAKSTVQPTQHSHIILCQCEIEQIQILLQANWIGALGDDDHATLNLPT